MFYARFELLTPGREHLRSNKMSFWSFYILLTYKKIYNKNVNFSCIFFFFNTSFLNYLEYKHVTFNSINILTAIYLDIYML